METTVLILVYVLIVGVFGFNAWLRILNYNNRNAEIPEAVKDVYDEEKYKKWQEYSMENFKFGIVVNTINTILLLILLTTGLFVLMNDWAVSLVDNSITQVLVFLGFYYVISFVFSLGTSYYHTFVIEEKFGFNKTTKKTFVTDKIKSLILTVLIGGGIIVGLLNLLQYTGNMFIIYFWLCTMTFIIVLNLLYTSVVVPIFNKLTPLEEGELQDAINAFADKVGYEVSKISVIDASKRSSKLNAYFTGFGKVKKIVLYDTLIEKMSTEEIVAVLAHEIGHNKHKHIIFNMVQIAITMFIYIGLFFLMIQSDVFSTAFGFSDVNVGFSLILFSVLMEPVGIILGIFTAQFSQKHEYQADKFSAENYENHYIESALKVLARENFSNLTPHPLFVKLTYSHPPIVDRIEAIRKVD